MTLVVVQVQNLGIKLEHARCVVVMVKLDQAKVFSQYSKHALNVQVLVKKLLILAQTAMDKGKNKLQKVKEALSPSRDRAAAVGPGPRGVGLLGVSFFDFSFFALGCFSGASAQTPSSCGFRLGERERRCPAWGCDMVGVRAAETANGCVRRSLSVVGVLAPIDLSRLL